MTKYRLIILLGLLPLLANSQSLQYAPYQLIWSGYPFVKSFHKITEMRISMYERTKKRKEEFEFKGEREIEFDFLGRSWVSHPEVDSSNKFVEYRYGMSYGSDGCPEYHSAKADSSGWIIFSKQHGIRNHCKNGILDTFIRGDTMVVHYDSLGRLAKIEQLTRLRGDTCWVYTYDELDRISRIEGPDNSTFKYPTDSIIIDRQSRFGERYRHVYVLGKEGLPTREVSFTYTRKRKPPRLIQRWDYEYVWREE